MATNKKVMAKRAELEVLGELLERLESVRTDTICSFEKTGTRQQTTWRGEPLWEDEEQTIPKMEDVWEYVPIPEDELTEEQKVKAHAIASIKATLEKMI